MSYLAVTLNHVRAIKAWAERHGGRAQLDLLSFELEVKARHRYFTLYPQFLARTEGRFAHVLQLTSDVTGFIGWLPYRAMRWPLSSDKLAFKRLLAQAGVRVPAQWSSPSEARSDHIVKRSAGSFGVDLAGPFRQGAAPSEALDAFMSQADARGEVFTEQFVRGRNLKVWFWGERVFHVQHHDYPVLRGDGASTVLQLATQRLERVGIELASYGERAFILQSLAYQGTRLDHILPSGEERWLDFRYGRRFCMEERTDEADNALPRCSAAERAQIDAVGKVVATELIRSLDVPVLYAVDGVLDDDGQIWWLEVNSNPIFAPTGYPFMLATLFGTSVHADGPDTGGVPAPALGVDASGPVGAPLEVRA
jgi:hypothetical protein